MHREDAKRLAEGGADAKMIRSQNPQRRDSEHICTGRGLFRPDYPRFSQPASLMHSAVISPSFPRHFLSVYQTPLKPCGTIFQTSSINYELITSN